MGASLTLTRVPRRCVHCTPVVLSSTGLGIILQNFAHLLINMINQNGSKLNVSLWAPCPEMMSDTYNSSLMPRSVPDTWEPLRAYLFDK